MQTEPLFIIASLKHTNKGHEHITFWGKDCCGYVLAVTDDRVGKYSEQEAQRHLNDGIDCLAVPVVAVTDLLSPRPYYAGSTGKARPFYDIDGPVVDNTRANWNRLIAASLPRNSIAKPKPEVFKGRRRSFAIELEAVNE